MTENQVINSEVSAQNEESLSNQEKFQFGYCSPQQKSFIENGVKCEG